jgi:hypothetical protein
VRRAARQALLIALATTLFATSCNPGARQGTPENYIPGKTDLTNVDTEYGADGVYLLPLDAGIAQELVREAVPAEVNASNLIPPGADSPIQAGTAEGMTNADGLFAIQDPLMDAVVPIAILDENGVPLEGIEVDFVSVNEQVTVLISDPSGQYQSQLLVVDYDTLLEGARQVDQTEVAQSGGPFSPNIARAAPEELVITISVSVVVLLVKVAVTALFFVNMAKLDRELRENAPTVYETLSVKDPEYICAPPEYIRSARSALTRLVTKTLFAFVPAAESTDVVLEGAAETVKEIALVDAEEATALLVEELSVPEDRPLLFRRYYVNEEIDELYREQWEKGGGEPVQGIVHMTPVGNCTEITDMRGMVFWRARAELERLGVTWEAEFLDPDGNPAPEFENGTVVWQSTDPIREQDGVEVRNFVPVGDWEGLEPFQIEILVRDVPDEETAEQPPPEEGSEAEQIPLEEVPPRPPRVRHAPPAGSVEIPNVTGLPLDEARDALKALGFGVTWLDGSSDMPLGYVFDQDPAAGRFFVPANTIVVLHRTRYREDSAASTRRMPSITLQNESEEEICHVYITGVSASDWGSDRLGDNMGIEPDHYEVWELDVGNYDVAVDDCDQQPLEEWLGVEVAGAQTLVLEGRNPAFVQAEPEPSSENTMSVYEAHLAVDDRNAGEWTFLPDQSRRLSCGELQALFADGFSGPFMPIYVWTVPESDPGPGQGEPLLLAGDQFRVYEKGAGSSYESWIFYADEAQATCPSLLQSADTVEAVCPPRDEWDIKSSSGALCSYRPPLTGDACADACIEVFEACSMEYASDSIIQWDDGTCTCATMACKDFFAP